MAFIFIGADNIWGHFIEAYSEDMVNSFKCDKRNFVLFYSRDQNYNFKIIITEISKIELANS